MPISDVSVAFRMLARQRGLALVAIAALALGIGLTTTMFSIVNGTLLRGLPFPEADRLQHIAAIDLATHRESKTFLHTYLAIAQRQHAFEEVAASHFFTANVVGTDGLPARYFGIDATPNLFRVLRVVPAFGPGFRDEDGRPGATPTVAISPRVWRERFNAAPDVIGRSLRVNGTAMFIVAVMPEKFGISDGEDVWTAMTIDPTSAPATDPALRLMGRLRAGATTQQATIELAAIWQQLARDEPTAYSGYSGEARRLSEWALGAEVMTVFLPMLAAVFFVLIVACTNIANLVLARVVDREPEIALRTALGATRWQSVRPILIEVMVLAVIGAMAGLGIAQLGIILFTRATVDSAPAWLIDIRIDRTVLLFVTCATLVAAFTAGIVPALRAARGTSRRTGRVSQALVIAELALSFSLLVMAGLLTQSIVKRTHADFGFATQDVWSARLTLSDTDYDSDVRKRQFVEAALDRLRALPGVIRVAAGTAVPLDGADTPIKFPDRVYASAHEYPQAQSLFVSSEFFDTLRVQTLEGRAFTAHDDARGAPVAIVTESFARRHVGRRADAIGQRVALAQGPHQEWRTIVGVVPDLGLGRASSGAMREGIYLPLAQVPAASVTLLVRTTGAPLDLTSAAREALRAIDPNLPLVDVATVQQSVEAGTWPYRVFGSLLIVFGGAALFLATVGLYGVMAFSVSRRTREIGVRVAIGATRWEVMRMVLRQGLIQIAAGITIGVATAAILGPMLRVLLFDVSPLDPLTWIVIASTLTLTGLAACLIPARRAARVDPMVALRAQ